MKYAIKILQSAREKLRELEDRAHDAELDSSVFSWIHVAREELEAAIAVVLTAYASTALETEKKKKKSGGGAKVCANCGGLASSCGGARACTNPAEAPTTPATPAAKKRGRPKGSARARQQQTIDDAIAPHRPTDPAPAMPSLPIGAHPLDELAGRVLEQNGAAT